MMVSGIDPGSILVISFTRKAAQEMRDRTEKITRSCLATTTNVSGPTIVTFHRFCLGALRSYKQHLREEIRNFQVQSRPGQEKVLR